MSLPQINKRDSLVWRLNFYQTALVALAISTAFVTAYTYYSGIVYQGIDDFLTTEMPEFKNLFRTHGVDGLIKGIRDEANEIGRSRIYFRLYSISGDLVGGSDLSHWKMLPNMPTVSNIVLSKPSFATIITHPINLKIRVAYFPFNSHFILEAGHILTNEENHLHSLAVIFGILTVVATVFSLVAGHIVLSRMVQRVGQVAKTASLIATHNITARVPDSGRQDELYFLALAFNSMLNRIEQLITNLKQVIENLSHELRTPLTRLRIEAELLARGKNVEGTCGEFILGVIFETDKLVNFLNSVLELSEMEGGITTFAKEDIDVAQLVIETCVLFELVAQNKQLTISIEGLKNCQIRGDRKSLERVFSNLLDNAIKYNSTPGNVDILIQRNNEYLEVSFTDSGIGFTEDDAQHVFERFYRTNQARKTHSEGNGLGLSIAKVIIELHGGSITASPKALGSQFTVFLPIHSSN